MPVFNIRMHKIVRSISPHRNFFHHPNRLGIACSGKGYDFLKVMILETISQRGDRCFRGITFSPERSGQTPADFDARHKASFEGRPAQTGKADKARVNALGKYSITSGSAFIAAKGSRSESFHSRKIKRSVSITIRFSPR